MKFPPKPDFEYEWDFDRMTYVEVPSTMTDQQWEEVVWFQSLVELTQQRFELIWVLKDRIDAMSQASR